MSNYEVEWTEWLKRMGWENYDTNRWSNGDISASIKPEEIITFYRCANILCKVSLKERTHRESMASIVHNLKLLL